MHTLLRTFVAASAYVQDAANDQMDRRGGRRALASVWSELGRLDRCAIAVAEELRDEPQRACGDAHPEEDAWLCALIDEVGAGTADQDESATWSWLARSTAWLVFCLAQAQTYAADPTFSRSAYAHLSRLMSGAEECERTLLLAAVTQASTHLGSMESDAAQQVTSIYDELASLIAQPPA